MKLRIRTYDAIKVDYDAPARRVGGISDDAPVDQTTERLQDLASAHSVAATTVGLPVDPTTERLQDIASGHCVADTTGLGRVKVAQR